MKGSRKNGFTLVEIMVVVVIVGLLAALAIPSILRVKSATENSRLMNDMRVFVGVIETFAFETGEYPEDSSSGAIPTGLEAYIKPEQWNEGPSIGGVWDVEFDSYSILSAVGVHRYTVEESQLERFDQMYDDGDLSNGSYRKLAGDRYYYVIAE